MRRYHVQRALRLARLSGFEQHSLLAGVLLIVAAVVAVFVLKDVGGPARAIGLAGLTALMICAASRGARLYRAGITASLPVSVGRVNVRVRPARASSAATFVLALVLPLGAGVAVLALVGWAWLLVAAVVLLGGAGLFVIWAREEDGE